MTTRHLTKALALTALALLALSVRAATVTVSSIDHSTGASTCVEDPSGTRIPRFTGYVGIGTFFPLPDFANPESPPNIAAYFIELFAAPFSGSFGSGHFDIARSIEIPQHLVGSPIYLVLGDGPSIAESDHLAVLATDRFFPQDDPFNPVPAFVEISLPNTQPRLASPNPPDSSCLRLFDFTAPQPISASLTISTSPAGRSAHLTWVSVPGRRYTIVRTANLRDWFPLAHEITANSTTSTYSDHTPAGTPLRFYRILTLPDDVN